MSQRRLVTVAAGQMAMQGTEAAEPDAGQIAVRTLLTLISPGTERAFILGLENTSQKYPSRPGYNLMGEVVQVGPGVDHLKCGDRVVAMRPHASYATASAQEVTRVPAEVPSEHAVFLNMLAIALQGVRKARIELGEPVLVLGQGLIGQLAQQLARLQGGHPVIAVDTAENRLALSRQCGADAAISPSDPGFQQQVLELTGGRGPSVVIESTGAPEPINTAFQLCADLGRVVLLGSTRGCTEGVNFYRDVHKKGLTILGAHNAVRPRQESSAHYWSRQDDNAALLRLLAAGRLALDPLISHRIKADDAVAAYEDLVLNWNPELMGAIIDWR
jgi:L-iditol 2-dehydrogenase